MSKKLNADDFNFVAAKGLTYLVDCLDNTFKMLEENSLKNIDFDMKSDFRWFLFWMDLDSTYEDYCSCYEYLKDSELLDSLGDFITVVDDEEISLKDIFSKKYFKLYEKRFNAVYKENLKRVELRNEHGDICADYLKSFNSKEE